MSWLLVNVQLEILIIDQKTPAFLVNREMRTVFLRQQVNVIAVRDLCFHLDDLTAAFVLSAHRVHIAEMT